jgi:hypothetical protein
LLPVVFEPPPPVPDGSFFFVDDVLVPGVSPPDEGDVLDPPVGVG